MTSLWDYNATPSSNTGSQPSGFGEGQQASQVDDMFRALMGELTEFAHSQVAGGTGDALTATLVNVPASLTDGMQVHVRASAANTVTNPTFNLNALGAHTITKLGGTALVAGDIAGNLHELTLRWNNANARWELLNPASIPIHSQAAKTSFVAADEIAIADSGASNAIKKVTRANAFPARTRQIFKSGSGTYTTPANALYIVLRMVGGGGGGGGNGTSGGSAGGTGGSSTFSTYTAAGGVGGGLGTGGSLANGGAGGAASGSPDIGIQGGGGYASTGVLASANPGGGGGNSVFGGGNSPGQTASGNGVAGGTNTGGGGAGANNVAATVYGGGGGGAGAYVEHLITSPAATYSYGVGTAGTAGTAGTSGNAGGAGGSGIVIVDEFYQ